ncbi:hypothetical protein [Pantoea cypripedii]|nr:hypothetical protein [Pantoea cypripedii]
MLMLNKQGKIFFQRVYGIPEWHSGYAGESVSDINSSLYAFLIIQ